MKIITKHSKNKKKGKKICTRAGVAKSTAGIAVNETFSTRDENTASVRKKFNYLIEFIIII